MKAKLALIILLAALPGLCGLSSCNHTPEPKYRIGVSQCSDDDWRDKVNEEIRREMLFHEDAVADIRTANDDNEKQIADIQYFIDNNYDIIVAAPNQAGALTPVLRKAYDKGIPVVIFDRGVEGDRYTAYIEFDNHGIGRSAADYASLRFPNGAKVIEIRGLEGSTPALGRHEGFMEGLARHPQLQLTASATAAWKEDVAEHVMDSLIGLYPDVDVVYAHNDRMAIGASKVLGRNGRRRAVVIGTDASPSLGIPAVIDSVLDATLIYATDGDLLIKTAMQILHGEPFERKLINPAYPPVEAANAELLLRQNDLLKEETDKILVLQAKNDMVRDQHRAQTTILYMWVGVGILLIVVIMGLLIVFWQRFKYQRALAMQNHELEQERDKQRELYTRLDEATTSRLAFFTNVSHDFRTPLTLIAEPVEQVASRPYLEKPDRDLMHIAVKNVRILRRLIDQILDFRTYETGHTRLHLSEVHMADAVRDWLDSFRSIAAKRNITLDLKLACDSTDTMAVDIEKIERVFFNLVSNAFKYSPDNGSITVDCRLDDSQLVVKVSDTGYGIKPEDRERIFDQFYQVAQVRPKGSGIGLALAKAFVELHGGTLTVDSEWGKGSTFTITLPVSHIETNDTAVAHHLISADDVERELTQLEGEERESVTDKPLVLLVDDNADFRHMVSQLLAANYNVIAAADGRQGLKLAAKYVPDLIISDLMMPVMDGLEFCRAIKGEVSTSHIPVLMLTACRMDEQRLESYQSGADAYLSKPFSTAMLLSRCQNLLDNRRRIKELYSAGGTSAAADTATAPSGDLNDRHSVESEFYNQFISTLKRMYTDSDLTTDTLAAALGLGAAQLTRKIKALTNYTPAEILRNYRLQKARKLLLGTEKTISEIAYEVGFSSPPYLSKCFKEAFGQSPSELRTR